MPPPVNDTRNDCEAVRRLWICVSTLSPSAPVPQPAAATTTATNDTDDNGQRDEGFGMASPGIVEATANELQTTTNDARAMVPTFGCLDAAAGQPDFRSDTAREPCRRTPCR